MRIIPTNLRNKQHTALLYSHIQQSWDSSFLHRWVVESTSMAITINESFIQFKRNLEITELQSSVVSTRQNSVRSAVDKNMGVLNSFLTGSYKRSTMIAPLHDADIDVFVVLENRYFNHYDKGQNGGQAGLLDLLRRTLLRTYTKTPHIARDGQAVTIHFSDFLVDVVPGFNRSGGGYLIANSIQQEWISTNPVRHVELISASNQVHEYKLVPLIKMIKAWNRNTGNFFHSFHIEILALEILNNVEITDSSSGARYFFDKGRTLVSQLNLDPAGYGGDIGAYINTSEKISTAVSKFETAYNRAIRAEDFARRGYFRNAVEQWRLIFGNYFPVYG